MRLPSPAKLRAAETDFVWVIVPFSRPENLSLVIANFKRQRFAGKKLVIVENGRALGATQPFDGSWSKTDLAPIVLSSERHQSIAKNTALHEIKRHGGGFTVVMDDDDWYGPDFLTEACGYARTYDVVGKNRHLVSVDGHMWLCGRETRMREASWLTGGTIACWAETAPVYSMDRHGEDARFCVAARKLGMSLFGTDVYHYLYRRNSSTTHAWRISAEKLRMRESDAHAYDLGAEDLSVVTGENLTVAVAPLRPRRTSTVPPPPGAEHVTT